MFFGEVKTQEAEGAILAHSVNQPNLKIKKGAWLTANDIAALQAQGIEQITVARLEMGDVHEDDAARAVGTHLASAQILAHEPFAGRVNLFAKADGLLDYDENTLRELNLIDEALTIAMLRPFSRVRKGQMIATIKIIPYAIDRAAIEACAGKASALRIEIHSFKHKSATLILSHTPNMKPSLLTKGEDVVRQRLLPIGADIQTVRSVPHQTDEISQAILQSKDDLVLILTASATSDRRDIAPQALINAGGSVERFGIPVDPGNLLFFGNYKEKTVIGLPGCVRAPVMNGADLVLEKIMADIETSDNDFADMSIGGLLKELPTRPQPRLQKEPDPQKFAAVILAAGSSSRMHGADKLTQTVHNQPLLAHLVAQANASQADAVYAVLPDTGFEARRDAAKDAHIIPNAHAFEGMAASLRVAVEHLASDYEALIFMLGDMPEINAAHINHLIAAYSPQDGREIIRAASQNGREGHPILFGQRFFEPILTLKGDMGAREILSQYPESIEVVRMKSDAPIIDLDTQEEWENWRKLHNPA